MSLDRTIRERLFLYLMKAAEFAFWKQFDFSKTDFCKFPALKSQALNDGNKCVQAKQNSFLSERFGKTKEVFNERCLRCNGWQRRACVWTLPKKGAASNSNFLRLSSYPKRPRKNFFQHGRNTVDEREKELLFLIIRYLRQNSNCCKIHSFILIWTAFKKLFLALAKRRL